MKIAENTFVALSYTLKVGGKIEDQSQEGQPLKFVTGMGMLLPKFEENLMGKSVGDKFEFTLTAAEGYGEIIAEAIIELPQSVFMIEGKVEDGLLVVGNQIPMATQDGQRMVGVILEVAAETVKMDFNHPMAGKVLDFSGEVLEVREPTEADMMPFMGGGGCNCGDCGDGDCEGGDCGDQSCGCGCN